MPVNLKNKEKKEGINVKFVYRDCNRECFLEVQQKDTADQMKERVKDQFRDKFLDPAEQLLMFRGIIFAGEEQPLGDPDLLKKAGDNIEIWILEQPLRYKAFCKAEKFKTINEKNKFGCTVLHRACVKAEIGAVEELLDKKGFKEVNAVDKAKMTALHRAMLCRFSEICLLLLKSPRFTALNQSDLDKRTVLHHAGIWGDVEICQAIIARPEFKSSSHAKRDVFNRTALECAEERGHTEAAEVLRAAMPELPPEDPVEEGDAENLGSGEAAPAEGDAENLGSGDAAPATEDPDEPGAAETAEEQSVPVKAEEDDAEANEIEKGQRDRKSVV